MISGVINVYKEKGITSFGVIARLRGILGVRRMGHTGTLDPDACGVLPVCIGGATKLAGILTGEDKTYRTRMHLGITTDTQDIGGKVLSVKPVESSAEEVRRAVLSFARVYDQLPPMYSALKVNGQKLCDLARKGKTVERKARPVTIYSIEIEKLELPLVSMMISCSRGTYIRTLCQDIGDLLGCGACMESLERTRTGPIIKEESHTLSQIEQSVRDGKLGDILIPADSFFPDVPRAGVPEEDQVLLRNGNPLPVRDILPLPGENGYEQDSLPDEIRLYTAQGQFAAVYTYKKDKGLYWPEKMFI